MELQEIPHPPVNLVAGSTPLVYRGCDGKRNSRDVQLDIFGAVLGFTYRITVQEIDPLPGQVHKEKEALFVMGDVDQSSTELKLELSTFDAESGMLYSQWRSSEESN